MRVLIDDCAECPFFAAQSRISDAVCTHPKLPDSRLITHRGLPRWCPLRQESTTIMVRPKASTLFRRVAVLLAADGPQRCSQIGVALWGATKCGPQDVARPAGAVMKRMVAAGLARRVLSEGRMCFELTPEGRRLATKETP